MVCSHKKVNLQIMQLLEVLRQLQSVTYSPGRDRCFKDVHGKSNALKAARRLDRVGGAFLNAHNHRRRFKRTQQESGRGTSNSHRPTAAGVDNRR